MAGCDCATTGAATVPATTAADCWALGALAFWIFTDAPLLPNATDAAAAQPSPDFVMASVAELGDRLLAARA